jgi:hypothetical protein
MLGELGYRSTLYDVDKPRQVGSRDYLENGIQLSGTMFDMNGKELKTGDRDYQN